MNNFFIDTWRFLLPALCLLIISPPLLAEEKAEIYGDWGRKCETPKGLDQELCFIFQNLSIKESGKRVMHITAGYLPKQDKPAMVFTLPLGVALRPGIRVKVDESEPMNVGYNICLNTGCRAGMELTEKTITLLKQGSKVVITFVSPQGKGLNVPVSLKGFTDAFDSLK